MSFILLGILNSQAAGAGAAGAYDLLETSTFTSNVSSLAFTGLDSYSDYKHLQVRASVRSQYIMKLNVNDDTGNNYARHRLSGDGSSVTSAATSSTGYIETGRAFGNTASQGGAFVMDILDFSSTNKNTTFRLLTGTQDAAETWVGLFSGLWNNTNAITKLDFSAFNGMDSGRFSLYGIKGA